MKKAITKLTEAQVRKYRTQTVNKGTTCRFIKNGENLNVLTGVTGIKGLNVIYHVAYYHFTSKTAQAIAQDLNCNVYFDK